MKDFKMAVPNDIRKEIQEQVFACGAEWIGGQTDLINAKFNYILVKENKMVFNQRFEGFLDCPLPEITLTEFFKMFPEKTNIEKQVDDILNDPEKSKVLIKKLFKGAENEK